MKKILLIEAELPILQSLDQLLKFHNFEVYTSTTGKDITAMIITVDPDLVLVDIFLPSESGAETCKEIKARFDLPVVLFSGRSGKDVYRNECEADAFIEDPHDSKKLLENIKTNLNKYQKIF